MIKLKRVVVTGLGMVSPLGVNVSQSWEQLVAGKSGIISIKSRSDLQNDPNYPDIYMGLIPSEFDEKKWQVPYITSRLNAYTMSAVDEAINDSKLDFDDMNLRNCTGVNIGIMNSNTTKLNEIISQTQQKGYSSINRMTMLHVLGNMPTANVSIKYKLKGPSATACSACATGAQSIGDSYRIIQMGRAKVMVVGGSEETLNPVSIHSSIRLQAMSTKQYQNPNESSRPYDKGRSGFILSEGSGVLIIEELEHALNRNAKIYAEILGYGCRSDGFHLTRPQDNGEGGLEAMNEAFQESQLQLTDIQFINSHATSTPVGDHAEVRAINNFFKNDLQLLNQCYVTANKSQLGHTFGAAGAIETIFSILSLKHQILPSILNLQDPIDEPYIKYAHERIERPFKAAIKNAFGFGGVNVSLVLK